MTQAARTRPVRATRIVCDFDRHFASRYDPAFDEGEHAFVDAQPLAVNPHDPNTHAFAHLGWRDGWQYARELAKEVM